VIAPGRRVAVRPTLSTRTVAVTADPGTQLKLPLPVSSLGLLNRRGLVPRTLSDGALIGGILAGLTARDQALGGLLLADDGDFAHAGHPALGYLRRHLPDGLGACRVVSVAALLAPVPGAGETMGTNGAAGRLVVDELAHLGWGGDPIAFFRDWLDLLFGVQVRLFARYGITLESHQQNAAVVVGSSRLGLLVKDFDGALIHHARLTGALGGGGPDPAAFGDQRLLTGDDDELADVFVTITVHLCAGALAFGLADRGYAPLPELLGMVRQALAGALDREADAPATGRLRARVLEAERLTGKAMVTAGTLTEKSRTGARDINKFYGPGGPNYLKAAR
jgi:siderophore synthetase component